MKTKILIVVLVLVVVGELFLCCKEHQWRKQAEEQAEASSVVIAEPAAPGVAEVEALEAATEQDKELTLLRQRNAVIAKEHVELMDKVVSMSLKLKAAEKELAQLKTKLEAAPAAE